MRHISDTLNRLHKSSYLLQKHAHPHSECVSSQLSHTSLHMSSLHYRHHHACICSEKAAATSALCLCHCKVVIGLLMCGRGLACGQAGKQLKFKSFQEFKVKNMKDKIMSLRAGLIFFRWATETLMWRRSWGGTWRGHMPCWQMPSCCSPPSTTRDRTYPTAAESRSSVCTARYASAAHSPDSVCCHLLLALRGIHSLSMSQISWKRAKRGVWRRRAFTLLSARSWRTLRLNWKISADWRVWWVWVWWVRRQVMDRRENLNRWAGMIPCRVTDCLVRWKWVEEDHFAVNLDVGSREQCWLKWKCMSRNYSLGQKNSNCPVYLFILPPPGRWAVSLAAAWKDGPSKEAWGGPGRPEWTDEEAQSAHCSGTALNLTSVCHSYCITHISLSVLVLQWYISDQRASSWTGGGEETEALSAGGGNLC